MHTIYPFCRNTTHSPEPEFHSHNNRRYCRVRGKQNAKYLKSPVSMQVWGANSTRSLSLLGKVNGNIDSAKYQSVIIYYIEMTCECVVFPQKRYISMHDLASFHNYKSTKLFLELIKEKGDATKY